MLFEAEVLENSLCDKDVHLGGESLHRVKLHYKHRINLITGTSSQRNEKTWVTSVDYTTSTLMVEKFFFK